MCDSSDVFLAFLAILFPPVAVWVKRGICSADSLINIALCALGFLPGLVHAWYIISAYPDPGYEQVNQEESVVYVVHGGSGQAGYGSIQPNSQFPGQQAGTANHFAKQPGKAPKMIASKQPVTAGSSSRAPAPAEGAQAAAANSSNPAAPPPTYADAIKGDNKVQQE